MMDIESHTMVFLRDLLATRAIQDAELTALLACWAYEELWHGEAISRFLGQAGMRVEGDPELTRWDDPYPSRVARSTRCWPTCSAASSATSATTPSTGSSPSDGSPPNRRRGG